MSALGLLANPSLFEPETSIIHYHIPEKNYKYIERNLPTDDLNFDNEDYNNEYSPLTNETCKSIEEKSENIINVNNEDDGSDTKIVIQSIAQNDQKNARYSFS